MILYVKLSEKDFSVSVFIKQHVGPHSVHAKEKQR